MAIRSSHTRRLAVGALTGATGFAAAVLLTAASAPGVATVQPRLGSPMTEAPAARADVQSCIDRAMRMAAPLLESIEVRGSAQARGVGETLDRIRARSAACERELFRDGTASNPDAGLLTGNGFSYTVQTCPGTAPCDGGAGGAILGNGGRGFNGGSGGDAGWYGGRAGSGSDASANCTEQCDGGAGGRAGRFGLGGAGGDGALGGDGGRGGVGGLLRGSGGSGGDGGDALTGEGGVGGAGGPAGELAKPKKNKSGAVGGAGGAGGTGGPGADGGAGGAGGASSTLGGPSSGIKRVSLATDRESTSGWITFRVKDARGLARNVSECQVTSGGRRVNCDAYPLRPTSYRDGPWKIERTSDGWEIRIFVGWLAVTSSQCWSLRSSQSWGVQIGLLSQGERLLTRRTHTYQAQCDGVAAQMTGPGTMVAREGQKSSPFKVTTTVLDRQHVATSVRRCFYDVDLREPTNCFTDPMSSVASKTALGWKFTRSLSYSATDRQECRELARQQPRRQYRLTFFNESGESVGTASHAYRLTCRR